MYLSRGIIRGFASRGRTGSGYFDDDYWQKWYRITAENQKYKGVNPGQFAILEEFETWTIEYCEGKGQDFEQEEFLQDAESAFYENGKYDAVSEIIFDASEELLYYWDQAFAGDGFGSKLFHYNL
jgi:hypothetical protein